jgi:hypothetical protein
LNYIIHFHGGPLDGKTQESNSLGAHWKARERCRNWTNAFTVDLTSDFTEVKYSWAKIDDRPGQQTVVQAWTAEEKKAISTMRSSVRKHIAARLSANGDNATVRTAYDLAACRLTLNIHVNTPGKKGLRSAVVHIDKAKLHELGSHERINRYALTRVQDALGKPALLVAIEAHVRERLASHHLVPAEVYVQRIDDNRVLLTAVVPIAQTTQRRWISISLTNHEVIVLGQVNTCERFWQMARAELAPLIQEATNVTTAFLSSVEQRIRAGFQALGIQCAGLHAQYSQQHKRVTVQVNARSGTLCQDATVALTKAEILSLGESGARERFWHLCQQQFATFIAQANGVSDAALATAMVSGTTVIPIHGAAYWSDGSGVIGTSRPRPAPAPVPDVIPPAHTLKRRIIMD